MKRWTIEGADNVTGTDRVVSIEAPTREDAEQEAHLQGVLVSDIHESSASDALEAAGAAAAGMRGRKAPASPLSYATPSSYRPQAAPGYEGIVKGAKLLQSSASTYVVFGVFISIFAAFTAIGSIVVAVLQSRLEIIAPGIVAGFIAMVTAFAMFNRAKMLRLQAELALATRDIARNSFNR